jgi:hypothetical protein
MKYAVLSTYRTASTFLHDIIRNHFGITGLGELTGESPLGIRGDDTLRHQYLNEHISGDNYVVKLWSSDFTPNNYWFNRETFDWSIFDKIIISTRSNVTDQLASAYYMKVYNSGPQTVFPIDATPEAIDFSNEEWMKIMEFMRKSLLRLHSMKDDLLTTYPTKAVLVPSELFHDTSVQYLPILHSLTGIEFTETDLTPTQTFVTGLNYSEKYTNYNDLEAIVDSWGIPN